MCPSATPEVEVALYSVPSRQVSHRELDLAIGKLPPIFDYRLVSSLRRFIEDFSGFKSSRINR
jgi:hypothetical protein